MPKDNSKIMRDCKACGKRTPVNMAHKLTTFISKNPPPKKVKGAKGAGKAAGQSVQEGDGAGSDDELTAKINAEAAHIPTAEQHAKGDDNEGWSVDTSEEAVKARVKALEGGLQSGLVLGEDDDDEEGADSPYNQYGVWLMENRGVSAAEVYKKAQELGIEKKHKAVQVLVQGIFTENAVKEVSKYAPVLVKMVKAGGEKHQKSLLGGVERLAGVQVPALVPNGVPKLLMALYQIDVVDEDFVKDWATKVSKKYVDKDTSKRVRKSAKPFVEWLDQADSDEDEDDSEEEDSDEDTAQETAPAPKAKVNGNGNHAKAAPAPAKEEEEEEEDEGQYDDL